MNAIQNAIVEKLNQAKKPTVRVISTKFLMYVAFAVWGMPFVLSTWLTHFGKTPVQFAWWVRILLTFGIGYAIPSFPSIAFTPSNMICLLWVGTFIATLFGF